MQVSASRLARQARPPACVPEMSARQLLAPNSRVQEETEGRKGTRERPPGTLPIRSAVFHWFATVYIILLNGGLIGGCANYGEIIH